MTLRSGLFRFLRRFLMRCSVDLVKVGPRPPWPEDRSRFTYQRLFNEFDIPTGSTVLDLGSGAYPFPPATILCDRFMDTTRHRSEKLVVDTRPFMVCDVMNLPLPDKSIDFLYCSHVLEHVEDPLRACSEITRVGKRGYIEVPAFAKDMLFSWADEMHRWHIVAIDKKMVFFEYSRRQRQGIGSDVWRNAIFAKSHHPMQDAYYNNPDIFNVMFNWSGGFECIVYRLDGSTQCEVLS
ncbi:MAG: class I SAM-dependent methyltransferase [Deltaproteobacteria bacterium]|nr:class I SAM-dependent methyltransferase [Deltaproteobacteria bacterium]